MAGRAGGLGASAAGVQGAEDGCEVGEGVEQGQGRAIWFGGATGGAGARANSHLHFGGLAAEGAGRQHTPLRRRPSGSRALHDERQDSGSSTFPLSLPVQLKRVDRAGRYQGAGRAAPSSRADRAQPARVRRLQQSVSLAERARPVVAGEPCSHAAVAESWCCAYAVLPPAVVPGCWRRLLAGSRPTGDRDCRTTSPRSTPGSGALSRLLRC